MSTRTGDTPRMARSPQRGAGRGSDAEQTGSETSNTRGKGKAAARRRGNYALTSSRTQAKDQRDFSNPDEV
jgi:hypothetical protein